jgi:hypothetical protein
MAKTPPGFVPLTSLKSGSPDPEKARAEIRKIYFATTRQTIDNDLAHAIALLQSLPSEEDREKAAVYMEGLAQMQREWAGAARRKSPHDQTTSKKPSKPMKPTKPVSPDKPRSND